MALSREAALVLDGYLKGVFPMGYDHGGYDFYESYPRAILPLDEFHCPRRLARKLKQKPFELKVNVDFLQVIRGCAGRSDTWINPDIVRIYCELHQHGFVHSVEAWQDDRLAGGLYGVSLGGAFFGESMFFRVSDASKAAFVHLVERLRERRFKLLDCQMVTNNTSRFGARTVSRREYFRILAEAVAVETRFAGT